MIKYFQSFLTIIFTFINVIPVQAQITKTNNLAREATIYLSQKSQKTVIFRTPPPPPNIGSPGQRRGGGSRGCLSKTTHNTKPRNNVLIALAPEYSKSQVILGLTAKERPTFWFYIPYDPSLVYAELGLEDELNEDTYKVVSTKTPGIIGVPLPSISSPLQIGKQYRWNFNIYCKQDDGFLASVEGNVQFQPLNSALANKLKYATPHEQALIYAANGIWYEALTILANLHRLPKQNAQLSQDWSNLLESVGLQNLASEPIIDCCQSQN